ncbi:MAG: M16 family metallopeptidase [Myxococcaceae bacterium]
MRSREPLLRARQRRPAALLCPLPLLAALTGCFSWNTHLPATPLGVSNGELVAAGGTATDPVSRLLEGSLSLKGRYGYSDTGDVGGTLTQEVGCDSSLLDGCSRPRTLYRFEGFTQKRRAESRRWSFTTGQALSLSYASDRRGNFSLYPGGALWGTVGVKPSDPLELYLSGRLSSNPGAAIGFRARLWTFVVGAELGVHARVMDGGNEPLRAALSVAIGYASDYPRMGPAEPRPERLRLDSATAAAPASTPRLNDPQRYTLANGLTVILEEDHSFPFVALNLCYRAGRYHEPPQSSGVAHLVEHATFEASEHIPEGAGLLGGAGALEMNALTRLGHTEYFETIPASRLETALWVESDRMAFVPDALDDEKLTRAKEAVKNEYRQRVDSAPHGAASVKLLEALFPAGHPRRMAVADADVDRLDMDQVKAFLRGWYRPSSATLTLVGDFDGVKTRLLVEKYFGTLEGGPETAVAPVPPVRLDREVVIRHREASASMPVVVVAWHTPALYEPGDEVADVVARLLSGSRTSRLGRLVSGGRLAVAASASQDSDAGQSLFTIELSGRPGVTPEQLLGAIDGELAALRDGVVSDAELALAKRRLEKDQAQAFSVVPNFGSRARLLQSYERQRGQGAGPDTVSEAYRRMSAEDVKRFAREHLDPRRRVVLMVDEVGEVPGGGQL